MDRLRTPRAAAIGLHVVLVGALVLFALVANQHYPLRHWLLWSYLRAWAGGLLFVAAAFSAGLVALRPLRLSLQFGERLVLGFALGVLVFVFGIVTGGLLGLFGPAFFFAWPLLLIAAGARDVRHLWRGLRRHLHRFGFALIRPRGVVEIAAAVLLTISLVAVYLHVITPINLGADAHWYHLPVAEHYARAGRIGPFVEGWYLGTYPQLASLLYTWAFQAPGQLFDRVALASHMEWMLFLATLASVAPLVRRLTGGVRMPYAAATMFAFPGLFLYDSSLLTMADHVLGFWAIPWGLALLALGRRFEARPAVLAGLMTAATLLTKYQGSYFAVPASLGVVGLAIFRRASLKERLVPVIAFGVAVLVGFAPHWLKNLVFYGDPMYPLLHRYFPSHPFSPEAAEILKHSYFPARFALSGTPVEKLLRTAGALFNFAFIPNDWDGFHRERPVFGALFTLLLLPLLFARAPRRLWLIIAGLHVSIGVWYVTSHQDRFLQGLMPLMAACTAAAAALIARTRAARWPLAALFTYQVLACADVYFIRTHAMIGDAPLKPAVDRLAAGHKGEYEGRFHQWGTLEELGRVVPKGAFVLVHEFTEKLGLNAPAVSDGTEWQGAIDYLRYGRPREVRQLWQKLGVTHTAFRPNRGDMSVDGLAREAVYQTTLAAYGQRQMEVGGYGFAALANAAEQGRAERAFKLAWLGCGGDPPTGVYQPRGLADRKPEKLIGEIELASAPAEALGDVTALIVRPACRGFEGAQRELDRAFQKTTTAGDVAVWVRK